MGQTVFCDCDNYDTYWCKGFSTFIFSEKKLNFPIFFHDALTGLMILFFCFWLKNNPFNSLHVDYDAPAFVLSSFVWHCDCDLWFDDTVSNSIHRQCSSPCSYSCPVSYCCTPIACISSCCIEYCHPEIETHKILTYYCPRISYQETLTLHRQSTHLTSP